MHNDKVLFSAYSALFNNVDNSIFMRNKITNKVMWIYKDENNLNLKINNEKRLKENLFKLIQKAYNNRINHYDLLLPRLNNNDIDNLVIEKPLLILDRKIEYSGHYQAFPRTFYCDTCGDFRNLNAEEWEHFDIDKCRKKGCNGHYKQLSFVKFCPKCGEIEPLFMSCEDHGPQNLKLKIRNIQSPSTWSLNCTECEKEGKNPRKNITQYYCNHKHYGETISNAPPTISKMLPVGQGTIYKSVVVTTVDVQTSVKNINSIDYIMFGAYLGEFDYMDNDLELINDSMADLEELKENPKAARKYNPDYVKELYKLEEDLEALKDKYIDYNLNELNDYLMLSGFFSSDEDKIEYIKYSEYSKKDRNEYDKYLNIKNDFKIEDITYIPKINLISSSIGSIKGINKFYEEGFVPHFEPHHHNEEGIIKVYSYPFETEGIMIDLDKVEVVNWLIENRYLSMDKVSDEKMAKDILIEIDDELAFNGLKTLIHTFSHVLIRRSSLYTGIDEDSCSEILFPKSAAFLIYSTSNINIGGFKYVFENSLSNWFQDIKLDINDCVFDPSCLSDGGACFSCLYLPEYVCSEFNGQLDRDVFTGKTERWKKGFWSEIE